MKLFRNSLFAVCLSLVLIFASSVLSTKVKIGNRILHAGSAEAREQVMTEIRKDASHFPGKIFINVAGIDYHD